MVSPSTAPAGAVAAFQGLCVAALVLALALIGGRGAKAGPVGFGQAARGGCVEQRCICHVRTPTQNALLACLAAPGSGTVVFDSPAPITIDSPAGGRRATVKIPSDKTIKGPVTLISNGTTLEIDGQRNIVIQDVTFTSTLSDHPACRDIHTPRDAARCGVAIYVLDGSRDIWIDHDTFTHCGEKCLEIWALPSRDLPQAGPIASPDLITVSDNRFADSYFGVAAGVDARVAEAQLPEHERVTFYGNVFDHIFRRTPRAASHAWIHAFNNYVRDWGGESACGGEALGFGPSSVGGAQLVLENNVLEAWPTPGSCKHAVDISDYVSQRADLEDRGPGLVRASGNEALNGAVVDDRNAAAVFNPRAYYSYTLRPAREVASILASAGARPSR